MEKRKGETKNIRPSPRSRTFVPWNVKIVENVTHDNVLNFWSRFFAHIPRLDVDIRWNELIENQSYVIVANLIFVIFLEAFGLHSNKSSTVFTQMMSTHACWYTPSVCVWVDALSHDRIWLRSPLLWLIECNLFPTESNTKRRQRDQIQSSFVHEAYVLGMFVHSSCLMSFISHALSIDHFRSIVFTELILTVSASSTYLLCRDLVYFHFNRASTKPFMFGWFLFLSDGMEWNGAVGCGVGGLVWMMRKASASENKINGRLFPTCASSVDDIFVMFITHK